MAACSSRGPAHALLLSGRLGCARISIFLLMIEILHDPTYIYICTESTTMAPSNLVYFGI